MKKIMIVAAAAITLTACSHSPKGWTVEGKAEGADGAKIALETFANGSWVVIDSITTDADGSFSYAAQAPSPFPEIMRLTLDGASIYFPVDSAEHLTIDAKAGAFATDYTIAGSDQAVTIARIDSIINANVAIGGVDAVVDNPVVKDEIFRTAYASDALMPLYYIMNRSVGSRQLFDLSNKADMRLYRAVAQKFNMERPDDPRTLYLVQNVAAATNAGTVANIEVPETALLDIVRYDEKGGRHSLVEMADQGKVVLLSFTSYDIESSPAYNVLLNSAWEKYHNAGLEIYQLAFDENETMWRQRAANLPWTTVWNANSDSREPLVIYNVGALPMTFIIDRQGQLAERVADPNDLEKAVAKYM